MAAKRTPIQRGDTATNGLRTGTVVAAGVVMATIEFADGHTQIVEKKQWKAAR